MDQTELVVLLDDVGAPVGTAPKCDVHTANTPLHLAFSCYLLDREGRILVTRRALAKRTWPGVWTNSFCGHPGPEEALGSAVRRRGRQELDVGIESVQERLPDFSYRAVDAGGTVENEFCPVFTAVASGPVAPRAEEVMEWEWAEPEALLVAVSNTPFVFSPWLREQLPRLFEIGAIPGGPHGA
jgi:isopentenyl-diphosphate delta-isomerase